MQVHVGQARALVAPVQPIQHQRQHTQQNPPSATANQTGAYRPKAIPRPVSGHTRPIVAARARCPCRAGGPHDARGPAVTLLLPGARLRVVCVGRSPGPETTLHPRWQTRTVVTCWSFAPRLPLPVASSGDRNRDSETMVSLEGLPLSHGSGNENGRCRARRSRRVNMPFIWRSRRVSSSSSRWMSIRAARRLLAMDGSSRSMER